MPQIDLRMEFGLYAGVRPIRSIPGVPGPLADPRAGALDFVIIRESTEGLFAHFREGVVEEDRAAHDRLTITRAGSERVIDFAFRLAAARKSQGGKGLVTSVDKANAFKSYAFFRKIFDERAALHPELATSRIYVDAMALEMVRRPWDYDVLVMENIFGDILSDLGAGLMGGLGFAPSADIGDAHAVFQPCHGTAPDIAGKGIANPTAMFLSGAMMLEWLGERQGSPETVAAGWQIRDAVGRAFAGGRLRSLRTRRHCGNARHHGGGDEGTGRDCRAARPVPTRVRLHPGNAWARAWRPFTHPMPARSPATARLPARRGARRAGRRRSS